MAAEKRKSKSLVFTDPNIRTPEDLTFVCQYEPGQCNWWNVEPPKTRRWSVHYELGRAYALELLDLIENNKGVKKGAKLNNLIFGHVAVEIVRQGRKIVNDGLYIGFFETISQQLIDGRVDR